MRTLIKPFLLLIGIFGLVNTAFAQDPTIQIARLEYQGGGDWYSDPTALANLVQFANDKLGTSIAEEEATVEPGSPDIFNYPFIWMTGHGNVKFSQHEARNLRKYLMGGGFLHIDDNYGMDQYIREELKKVFPDKELVELPFNHPIYHQMYNFDKGPPKIHKHDEKPAQGFGIIHEGRLLLYYTYESDLGDGWEPPTVHDNPPEVREKALKMGTNILQFAFMAN